MTSIEPVAIPAPPAGDRGQLASAVATAVDAVAGARRTAGSGVEIATQYRGGKALGIQLGDDDVSVHIVAEKLPLEPLIRAVRSAAVSALVREGDRRQVAVFVDDLDVADLPKGL